MTAQEQVKALEQRAFVAAMCGRDDIIEDCEAKIAALRAGGAK